MYSLCFTCFKVKGHEILKTKWATGQIVLFEPCASGFLHINGCSYVFETNTYKSGGLGN